MCVVVSRDVFPLHSDGCYNLIPISALKLRAAVVAMWYCMAREDNKAGMLRARVSGRVTLREILAKL